MNDEILIQSAKEALQLSYSPYSHFKVGAAVLLSNGNIIKGANQENASYPVGICAERSTLATAQNLYPNTPIEAIALVAEKESEGITPTPVTPCGMCRQALAECEQRYNRPIRVIMVGKDKTIKVNSIKELLPLAFS